MRKSIKDAFVVLGGDRILRVTNRTPRVLFWHGVDNIKDAVVEAETCNSNTFINQIKYLKRNYEIVSIDEFYNRYVTNSFTGKEIVLTFDDGYKNNLTVVAPFLKSLYIPFTVFISTNHISSGALFPTSIVRLLIFGSQLTRIEIPLIGIKAELKTHEQKKSVADKLEQIIKSAPNTQAIRINEELLLNVTSTKLQELVSYYSSLTPMNWDEVRDLRKYNCTIGSHCLDHICCHENQDESEILKQILESKQVIESELEMPCHYFAYPNGDYTDYSNKCIKESGYRLAFSARKDRILETGGDSFCMPRIHVPHEINTFKIFINLHPIKRPHLA